MERMPSPVDMWGISGQSQVPYSPHPPWNVSSPTMLGAFSGKGIWETRHTFTLYYPDTLQTTEPNWLGHPHIFDPVTLQTIWLVGNWSQLRPLYSLWRIRCAAWESILPVAAKDKPSQFRCLLNQPPTFLEWPTSLFVFVLPCSPFVEARVFYFPQIKLIGWPWLIK